MSPHKAHFYKFIFIVLLLVTLSCQSSPKIVPAIGIAVTTEGQEVLVQEVRLDENWAVPIGNVMGTWAEGGAGAVFFNKPTPTKVYVKWWVGNAKKLFEVRLKLPENLAQKIAAMPPAYQQASGKKLRQKYILIGIKKSGRVVLWLTNSPRKKYIKGREIEELSSAMASAKYWEPKENTVKNKKNSPIECESVRKSRHCR